MPDEAVDRQPSVAAPASEKSAEAPSLVFDGSSFESANLAGAKLISSSPLEYDLHIRADTLNARHRVWFYFCVRGAKANQKVIFNLVGYSKTKSLFREGMAPVVCSSGRPYWERLPPTAAYYYRSPRHDRQYVLSFPFCFERADETYYFAYCFPYTYSYLQRFLFALEGRALPHLVRDCLCRSLQERRLELLTVSSPANLRLDAAIRSGAPTPEPLPTDAHGAPLPKRVVFISSRVHPGETPASFVMHGLLLFLISDHPKARELREAVIFKIVPMLNPDGVFIGNYRCNSVGLDLNRLWHASTTGTAPTVHAMRECAQQYMLHPAAKLEMILDMHAHSVCMNGFMFANLPDNPKDIDAVAAFPRVLGQHAKDFAAAGCKFDTDPSKAGTGRRALSELLPGVHCYTMEVSMYCSANGNVKGDPYQPSSYTEMGHAVGLSLHEHYCVNGGAAAPWPPAAAVDALPRAPAAPGPIRGSARRWRPSLSAVAMAVAVAAAHTADGPRIDVDRRAGDGGGGRVVDRGEPRPRRPPMVPVAAGLLARVAYW